MNTCSCAHYGGAAVMELHQQFYRGILAPFLRTDIPCIPHIIVDRTHHLKLAMADTLRELTLPEVAAYGSTIPLATIALDQP